MKYSLLGRTIGSIFLVSSIFSIGSSLAFADTGYGTADEAKAMLESAMVALSEDEGAALVSFTAGEAPFKLKDLYVFCGKDGIMSAHGANPAFVGQETMAWKDKAGKLFVKEMYAVAAKGEFNVVEYMWPRVVDEEPVGKASYVTVAAGQMCGVGYYK